jgi:origin recognition complex subunit 1
MAPRTKVSNSEVSKSALEKAERARQYLRTGGVIREDSDDELGDEDLPWEWIFDESTSTEHIGHVDEDEEEAITDTPSRSGRKRKVASRGSKTGEPAILGARMGSFECRVGDTVLLKAEGNNEAWVGIICEFMEEEDGEKVANFMWFATEKEIRSKEKKRTDFVPVGPLISC